MKKSIVAGVVMVPLAGWLGGTAFVAGRVASADAARARQHAEIAALGEKVAGELAQIGSAALKDACAGKMKAEDAYALVSYVLKLPSESRPALDGARVDAMVSRMVDHSEYLETSQMDPPEPEHGFNFARAMSPDDWSRMLDRAAIRQQHTDAVKYVLLTEVSDLRPASVSFSGATYAPGGSRYRTRVVSWPGGETICEGAGDRHLKQKEVIGHGASSGDARTAAERKLAAAWAQATVVSSLDDVCEAGGKSLCFATQLAVDGPDW